MLQQSNMLRIALQVLTVSVATLPAHSTSSVPREDSYLQAGAPRGSVKPTGEDSNDMAALFKKLRPCQLATVCYESFCIHRQRRPSAGSRRAARAMTWRR